MSLKEELKNFIKNPRPYLKSGAKKTWEYIKRARVELIVLAAVFALDLITKGIIQATIKEGGSVEVIPNFLYFTYVLNSYAAFGTLFGLEELVGHGVIRRFLIVFTIFALIGFFYCMVRFRRERLFGRITFALIIAGTLGNFYDRLFTVSTRTGLHGVRDFIHFKYFGLDLPLIGTEFAIFNIADSALTVGVVMFAVFFFFMYKPPPPELAGPVYRPDWKPEECGDSGQGSEVRDQGLEVRDQGAGIRSQGAGDREQGFEDDLSQPVIVASLKNGECEIAGEE